MKFATVGLLVLAISSSLFADDKVVYLVDHDKALSDVVINNFDFSQPRIITTDGSILEVKWLDEKTLIANADGKLKLFNTDGSLYCDLTTETGAQAIAGTPDGKWIVFSRVFRDDNPAGKYGICRIGKYLNNYSVILRFKKNFIKQLACSNDTIYWTEVDGYWDPEATIPPVSRLLKMPLSGGTITELFRANRQKNEQVSCDLEKNGDKLIFSILKFSNYRKYLYSTSFWSFVGGQMDRIYQKELAPFGKNVAGAVSLDDEHFVYFPNSGDAKLINPQTGEEKTLSGRFYQLSACPENKK